MKKYTQKQLKDMVANGQAIDITDWDFDKVAELAGNLETIGTSHGRCGMNGLLGKSRKAGVCYAICKRNSLLQMIDW